MDAKLFGVPLVLWGGICIVLTIIWLVVWPSDRAVPADGIRFLIVRWFHALTWALLALAALLAAFHVLGGPSTARLVALLALLVYVAFLATFLTSQPR